jgi:hypothetical protein
VIENCPSTIEDIGVGMYSSLMGTFDFMAPIHHIYAMSSRYSSSMRYVPFHTLYFNDPWTLPSLTMSCEGQSHIGMTIPLSTIEVSYWFVLNSTANPDLVSLQTDEEDPVLKPVWATQSYFSHDCLDDTLPLDESILEAMNGPNRPWDDMHHHSYFLPELVRVEQDEFRSTLSEMVCHVVVPLDTHRIYAEGNMANICPTVTIDISRIPRKIENVYIDAYCSLEEI